MVRIKVKNNEGNLSGKVLEADYIDDSGDACLNSTDAEEYGTRWVFKDSFVQVNEDEVYKVTINIKNLLELYYVLDSLPQNMLESATLETI